jgi:hypothetical protein
VSPRDTPRLKVDFNELFAEVAHRDTVWVFISLVDHLDLECDQVHIKAAFLNGNLEETIYLSSPEGSNIPADKVFLLWKSLHGLKQSPRFSNKALDKWLKSQGLILSQADPCHYYRCRGDEFLMLSVHVGDQTHRHNNRQALDDFKQQLNAKFKCSDSGPA